MKQLSVVDKLFNSIKQIRKIFSNDMAIYSSGRVSGAIVSLLLSDKYDYFYMCNIGRYGVDDIFSRLIV